MKKNIIVLSTALALMGLNACQSSRSTPSGDRRSDSLSTASTQMNNMNNSSNFSTAPGASTPATTNTGVVEQAGMVPNNSFARSDNRDQKTTASQPNVNNSTSSNSSIVSSTAMNRTAAVPDRVESNSVSKESAPTVNSYLSQSSRSGNTSGKSLPNNPENSVAPPTADSLQRSQAMTTPGQRNGVNATEAMTAMNVNTERSIANTTSGSGNLMTRVSQQLDAVDRELKNSPSQARRMELNKKRQMLVGALNKLQEVEQTLSKMEVKSGTAKE
ncbi:hypothetical protein [Siphonobacter sp. SORGH_AS_1065]|uniref:hypothetical protein n=1 Tax=Siphonobacter sp. SORGH_AS_1065 TaxID=3041795 RepID=UPI00277E4597|nr:hypothetical protein [Siphonobacter sp. SORGH_AS_1065]MDQ1086014.1 hypothetical protein [Siphonobacter sp. SORGH_AS_1065]